MKHDNNNVHVKFFGAHDRAWVPVKECYLYSKKDPNTTNKIKRSNIAECVKVSYIQWIFKMDRFKQLFNF